MSRKTVGPHPIFHSILEAHGAPKPLNQMCNMCDALPGHPCSINCPCNDEQPKRDIVAHYDPPPIPVRQFDWSAVDRNTYDGAPDSANRYQIGWGRTEQEAVADLLEKLDE